MPVVTLHEIASAADVSIATVSRALTNSGHPVSSATKQRIIDIAKELGYRPNLVARSLKTDRTFTIGIITDTITSPFSPLIIRGIQDHLEAAGYFSIILNGDWNPEVETEAIQRLLSRAVDGLIFVESWLNDTSSVLKLTDKPHVFVHRLFDGEDHRNRVSVDENYGTDLAIEHLVRLGHRRIAFINGPGGWYASEHRLIGYQETLARSGIAYDPQLVIAGDWEVQSGFPAARQFLELPHRPTAIFAANDLMALGAIYAIQEAGLRVPEDIAIVGYDDREIANLTRPTITTVTMPCYEMGQAAAQLMSGSFENGENSEDLIKVQGTLIVRESCGGSGGRMPLEKHQSHSTPKRLLRKAPHHTR
jgi:LacI family transcriptional regulator